VGEPLTAVLAQEGLLTRVDALVLLKIKNNVKFR
jgi:hypothetical protein